MGPEATAKSYWAELARAYASLAPPLRPSSEDIRFMEQAVAAYASRRPDDAIEALLLGVTPDIVAMQWPGAASLLAVDSSGAMAKSLWPAEAPPGRWAVCANWLALPRRRHSCDVVIGDGSMNCLRYPDDCLAMAASVRGVLRNDGMFVLRCYAQPEVQERPEHVYEAALRTEIPTFTQFKFRLLMAMQRSTREGVAVNEIYDFWAGHKDDEPRLMERTGWRRWEVDTIELYRGANNVHTFPTLAESRAVLHEFFDEVCVSFPSYYAGERCPRLVLKPRPGDA